VVINHKYQAFALQRGDISRLVNGKVTGCERQKINYNV